MGDRSVPFDENVNCDICGIKGAFDFMGDYLCHNCAFPPFRCQRNYEGESTCETQCDHCKQYYGILEKLKYG